MRTGQVLSAATVLTISADVTVTNLGDPVTSWTLTWSFGAGQTVTQAWDTTLTRSGAAVTAENLSYNGTVATGGTASFGFNGTWTGSNPAPASFAMNGVSCGGTATPSTTTPSAAADITVDTATPYQTIDGFGAGDAAYGTTAGAPLKPRVVLTL